MTTEVKKQGNATQDKNQERNHDRLTETNVYRLSSKTNFRQAIFICKIILKKHGNVQIESIGTASSEASRVIHTLEKHGYATLKSLRTEQFVGDRDEGRFQTKLIGVLDKSAEFDKLTENIEIRE